MDARRRDGVRKLSLVLMATAAFMIASLPLRAGETPAAGATTPIVIIPAGTNTTETPTDTGFTTAELRRLLAPFALYPDSLLAQLLPATAYPADIFLAGRWLDKNEAAVKKDDFSGADAQGWDPTVKALVRFPDIIKSLNTHLDSTSDLGDAFVNQPGEVAAVIQKLRREAQKAGSLKSTPQQTVTMEHWPGGNNAGMDYVVIAPTNPGVIYVPTYDPTTVYYEHDSDWVAGAVGFGAGIAVGVAVDNVWNWSRGWVYPPRWPGYPGYLPSFPGRRADQLQSGVSNSNINIGNDINIGAGNTRRWRPDAGKYRPGQITKPGLAGSNNPSKPGVANQPGGQDHPVGPDRL